MLHNLRAQTLANPVMVIGNGLHGNKPCTVTLRPAQEASGIVFHHLPSGIKIPAKAELVSDCTLATTLTKDGIKLQTIEHLLSALMGLNIHHLTIELTGDELPIVDGSANPWVNIIEEANIRPMDVLVRSRQMVQPIEIRHDNKWIRISPYPTLRINYTINFANTSIGTQSHEFIHDNSENYILNIGPARTFCLEKDIELMHAMGLAKGGSLDNAVVFGPNGPLNDTLRFSNEAVRHKILDLLGDLKLLEEPIIGHIEAYGTGHAMHVALVKAILAQPDAWHWL